MVKSYDTTLWSLEVIYNGGERRMSDSIDRKNAIDLVKDVCDAIMSGCDSWYDPEIEDEVYKDIREVDAILKCNKEIRIALRNMPSAESEYKELQDWKTDFKGFIDALDILRDDYRGIMEYIDEVPSAEPEIYKQNLIRMMNEGIIATNTKDVYSCGMRNGIRWCRALLEDDTPKFENASQYAEPERKKGKWIDYTEDGYVECPYCHSATNCDGNKDELHYCYSCGAELR